MKTQVTRELLFTYFAGRATVFQKQLIDEWAKEPGNRELFYEWLEAWESQHPQYLADASEALNRHQERMQQQPPDSTDEEPRLPGRRLLPRWNWLGMIAAAAAVLVVSASLFFRDNLLYKNYTTAYGEIRQLTLPDGSRVTLNANSSLKVPRLGFGWQTREVSLVGEATFDVKHQPDDQPFVVKTARDFEVVVLGTEFTVYNRERAGKVVLNRGKVQLRYQEGQTTRELTMKPGELVMLDPTNRHAQLRQLRRPETLSAWRENRFVFDETSLREIAFLFEENYGLHLKIADPELAAWTVSGSYTARNAQELLESLMDGAGLTYTRSGNTIVVTNPEN